MRRERQPWERRTKAENGRKRESDPAWEAFCMYRDMGLSRSLAKVASPLGKSVPLLERWSRTHSWVERAQAWDAEQDRLNEDARHEARRKEHQNAEQVRGLAWASARLAFVKYIRRLQDDEERPTARDCKALADTAMTLTGLEEPAELAKRTSNATIKELLIEARDAFGGILGQS